jgi:hypothetical protein
VSADRDWDKELAAIDKVMAKAPAAPGKPAALPPAGSGSQPPARSQAAAVATVGRSAALFTWVRVLLAVLVAAAMTQWPYLHDCGTSLFLYLGAVGGVILAGLWSSVTSWQRRMGLAHSIALLVTLWGLLLAGQAVLPRIGYARAIAHWWCS